MTRIMIHGCGGRMGHFVANMAAEAEDVEVIAGVDPFVKEEDKAGYGFPVYKELKECPTDVDVVVDFSVSTTTPGLMKWCSEHRVPCVLCTTGLDEAQLKLVKETSKTVAILRSANMSPGLNLMLSILRKYSGVLAKAGFDCDIVEKHHNQKLDAPSGTAVALAEAVIQGIGEDYDVVYDRSGRRMKRPVKEIGVSAVRGGTIVGDHDVIFAGKNEVITFSHNAYSRELFANGALLAAKFLAAKGPGMYDMQDMMGDLL